MTRVRRSIALTAAAGLAVLALPFTSPAQAAVDSVTIGPVSPKPPGKLLVKWTADVSYPVDYFLIGSGDTFTIIGKNDGAETDLREYLFDVGWGKSYNLTVEAVGVDRNNRTESATTFVQGYRLSAQSTKNSVLRGERVRIQGSLIRAQSNGTPEPNATVVLQKNPAPVSDNKWVTVKSKTTNDLGKFAIRATPMTTTSYRLLYSEKGAGGWRAGILVKVRVKVTLSVRPNPVSAGQTATFRGTLKAPARLVSGADLQLQRRVSGSWRAVATSNVRPDGTYAIPYRSPNRLDSAYRVVTPGGQSFDTSVSRTVRLTVT